MIDTCRPKPGPRHHGPTPSPAWSRLQARGTIAALLIGHATGCATFGEGDRDTSEGEAILTALEHVAALKWEGGSTPLLEGKLAVAYDGESPLSESTRGFLDDAFEARGWRWSTEDPLVPNENCRHPSQACRLKDPTELHLTFSWVLPSGEACAAGQSVPPRPPPAPGEFCWEPVAREERHGVHIEWLSSFYSERLGRDWAELGGYGMLFIRGTDGWVAETHMQWIT